MLTIPVDQVRGNFYGGYPYKVSWTFGGDSEPSKLNIEVVNEQGSYGTPQIGLNNIQSVAIGSFTFRGYLVGYNLSSTPEQKTLVLEYVDCSIDLDKYWVGLFGVHPEAANTIIVGKKYHPCDINMDSTIDYNEENIRLIDTCDPCPFSPVDKYKEACDPRIENIEIFDTYYTFSDLISKIAGKFSNLNIDYDGSNLYMYKAQHIGNLRNVLSSWCSDLGLSFFWDPLQDKLVLKSRNSFGDSQPASYEEIVKNPRAMDINYRESVLETFSQGFMGRYERPGKFEKYPCSQNTWKMLRPITLEDLFLPDPTPVGSTYSGPISAKSVAVALSYYSSALRDSFLWFVHYGIKNAEVAQQYVEGGGESNNGNNDDSSPPPPPPPSPPPETSGPGGSNSSIQGTSPSGGTGRGNSFVAEATSIDSGAFDYQVSNCGNIDNIRSQGLTSNGRTNLIDFGNMKIRAVYSINSSDSKNKSNFYKCRNNMPRELVQIYMGKDGTPDNPKFYFFVAECSEEGYDASTQLHSNLANNFLGTYYFNKFRTIITGASEDETECQVEGPGEDGNGTWHKAKAGVENIQIFKYGHDENSMIDKLKKTINEDIEENNQTESQRLNRSGAANKRPEDFVANSFILFSRSATRWSPEKEFADKWYGTLYAWANQQIPHKYANTDGRPDILYTLFPEAKWNENIKLFIVRETDEINVDISTATHPTEVLGGNKLRVEEDVAGQSFAINEGPWGLRSKNCYLINFCGVMPIYTPPGSFAAELSNYTDECVTAPSYSLLSDNLYSPVPAPNTDVGYRVFVSCSSEFPRLIPKFFYNTKIDAPNAGSVRKVDYVDYQLSEQNLAIFGDQCTPDRGTLNNYLTDLGSTSEYSYSKPFYNINFKLAGTVPEIWSVQQGLSSMSVEVTENGVFTEYGLSTKIIQPPSLSYIEQNLRFQSRSAFGKSLAGMTSVKAKTIRH
jgi:hypothetical protein